MSAWLRSSVGPSAWRSRRQRPRERRLGLRSERTHARVGAGEESRSPLSLVSSMTRLRGAPPAASTVEMDSSFSLFSLWVDRDLTRLQEFVPKSSSSIAVTVNTKGSPLGLPFEQDAKEAGHIFSDLARVLFCEWTCTAPVPDFQRSVASLAGRGLATT